MKRKKFVRLELMVLAAVILLLAYRVIEGPPPPKGLVVYTDIEPDELQSTSFAIDLPLRVSIDAVGSYHSEGESDPELAAYGWLLRRENRAVAWTMNESNVRREGETLAVTRDTVELAPGTYDVYYTSLGSQRDGAFAFSFLDRIFGDGGAWRENEKEWKMVIRRLNGQNVSVHEQSSPSESDQSPAGDGLLWSTAPMRGHETSEFVFNTSEALPLRIYAIGEIDDEQLDFGWMENAVSGERLWEMTLSNTKPAGGWSVNRLFDDSLLLEPGIYRAAFVTDARQNFEDWVANPPFDPAGWGISLFTSRPNAVREFDPWEDRQPVVKIMEVGDDERHSAQFQVHQPVSLTVFALGEMSDGGRYDYAWISNNDTQETIWEMTYERSNPAEGDNNRKELAFLELSPGTYTVTYETDDSHSFESWRHGRPEHPERWGVAVFPLEAQIDSTVVQVLGYSQESLDGSSEADAPHPPGPPEPVQLMPMPGSTLIDLTQLGNEKHVQAELSLGEESVLHVRSVGEISLSGRYDYGWIERADNGEIVWEMTWQNTQPAGGDDSYRMFDGPISLAPGQYVVHYKTDFSNAFGDFGDQAPHMPQSWGIRISKP